MTIEMERPFVWPEEPKGEDLEKWDKKNYDAVKAYREDQESPFRPNARQIAPTKERDSIASQAKAMLKGKEEWKPTGSIWENVGEEVEVETDVQLPKID